MLYLNKNLSIKGLHAKLEKARLSNVFGVIGFEIGDNFYDIQPHNIGLALCDGMGKIVKTASLIDYDYAESNSQALDYLVRDLYDQITTFC